MDNTRNNYETKALDVESAKGLVIYQDECSNFLRRQNKEYPVTLSDDKSVTDNKTDDVILTLIACGCLEREHVELNTPIMKLNETCSHSSLSTP